MLMRVRTGYGIRIGGKEYRPGDTLEMNDADIKRLHWKLEPANYVEEAKPAPKVEAPKVEKPKVEDPVLENRAVLDTKAGAPLIRRNSRGRK